MAVDTSISALAGAPAVGQKIQVYQREVDFSVNNLAAGAHFALFDLDAGDVVIAAQVQTVTADTAAADVDVGVDGGDTLIAATDCTSAGFATGPTAAPVSVAVASVVSVEPQTNGLTDGVLRFTCAVLKAGDFSG